MVLKSGQIMPIQMFDQNGNPINSPEKMFLLLLFADKTGPDTYETQHFEVSVGRFNSAEMILNFIETSEYGRIDIFKSVVISEKSNNFAEKNISFYTFLRHSIEHGEPIGIREPNGSPLTVDDLNEFILLEFDDQCAEMGIENEDDLNRFYEADGNYKKYIPNTKE